MAQGPHIVTIRRPGKPVLYYVYAWRGGPVVHKQTGGAVPKLTGAIIDAIAQARAEKKPDMGSATIKALITDYRASPEWNNLAKTTRENWLPWLDRIDVKFGKAKIRVFNDRRIRGDILAWRDQWADKPRSADMAIQVISRLLSWGFDRGELEKNHAAGIDQLYETDRSAIIWMDEDFTSFNVHASIEVQEAVELAACTGLRRGDLVQLPWDAIGEHAIVWQTAKSRGKARIVIPLLPETLAVLDRIKTRHAAEMERTRPSRRKDLPATVLSNASWRAWTPKGFGSRFNDGKQASGIKVNLHDLRGTFATRCMIAGLTDQEIAYVLGWTTKDVAAIRVRYVDQARVVIAIAERINATKNKA